MGMRVDPSQHERRVARPDRPYPGTLLVRIDGVQPKTSRKNQPYLQISMTLVAYVAPPTSPLPPHLQGVVPHPGTKYSVPIYQGDYYEKDVTTLLCAAHNCEPSQLNASFFDAMVGPSQALRGVFLLSEAWHSYSQKNDIAPDGSVFPGRKGFLNWMPHNALGTLEEVRQYVVDDATYQRVVVNGG